MITEFTSGNLIAIEKYYNGKWGLKRYTNNIALISEDGSSIDFLTQPLETEGTTLQDIATIVDAIKLHNKNKNDDN